MRVLFSFDFKGGHAYLGMKETPGVLYGMAKLSNACRGTYLTLEIAPNIVGEIDFFADSLGGIKKLL